MKKLFVILVLMFCGFLYAEVKRYMVTEKFNFSLEEPEKSSGIKYDSIKAVYPYDSAYIIKTTGFEIYVDFSKYTPTFYVAEKTKKDKLIAWNIYRCRITEIHPNEFNVEQEYIKTLIDDAY